MEGFTQKPHFPWGAPSWWLSLKGVLGLALSYRMWDSSDGDSGSRTPHQCGQSFLRTVPHSSHPIQYSFLPFLSRVAIASWSEGSPCLFLLFPNILPSHLLLGGIRLKQSLFLRHLDLALRTCGTYCFLYSYSYSFMPFLSFWCPLVISQICFPFYSILSSSVSKLVFNLSVDFLISVIIIFIPRSSIWLLFRYHYLFHIFSLRVLFPTFFVLSSFKHIYFIYSFSNCNFIITSAWNSNNLVCCVCCFYGIL